MGAQWAHSFKSHHPLATLGKKVGMTFKNHDWDDAAYVSIGTDRRAKLIPGVEVDRTWAITEKLFAKATTMREKKSVTRFSSLSSALEQADTCLTSGVGTDLVNFYTRSILDDDYGAGAEELSLLYFDADDWYGGYKTTDAALVGGIATDILSPWRASLSHRIRLDHCVQEISRCHGIFEGVKVRGVVRPADIKTKNTQNTTPPPPKPFVMKAKHVVVTVPLGVLKAPSNIRFQPSLSTAKRDAIERVGVGSFLKVALLFDKEWWTRQWGAKTVYCNVSSRPDDSLFRYFVPLSHAYEKPMPVLVAFVGGPQARKLEKLSDAEVKRHATNTLQQMLLRPIIRDGHPVGVHSCCIRCQVSRWDADPFSKGCYSYMSKGCKRSDRDRLAAPEWPVKVAERKRLFDAENEDESQVAKLKRLFDAGDKDGGARKHEKESRVHTLSQVQDAHGHRLSFAGEHTYRQYPSTMHGALLSGWREARRVMLWCGVTPKGKL